MKTKLIVSNDLEEFNKSVNDFIKDKKVKDIKFTTDVMDGIGYYNALILYENS